MKSIAIIGLYGVGKTTFLQKVEKYGYSVLYTDVFFKQCYQKGNQCYKIIQEKLGEEFIWKDSVNRDKLRDFILIHHDNINILEKLVYPVLEKHLENNHYDFVEIPNVFTRNANFERFFTKIINLFTDEKTRQENIIKKNVDKKNSDLNNALNKEKNNKKIVNISIEKTKEKDFFEVFFKSICNL